MITRLLFGAAALLFIACDLVEGPQDPQPAAQRVQGSDAIPTDWPDPKPPGPDTAFALTP